ncbi:putative FHA domain protein SNIP1 [Aspergillus undulatus]|uniref:putative FHA domain protein SNIP1 n=1 Tax=Aspergillus undulatus TaxID=1810928 RepID=UPI003CCDA0B7
MPTPREDDYTDRRRRRSPDSRSPDRDRDRRRRRHDDDYDSSRKHHRSSRKDSPRRRSSCSPSSRTSHRREYERRHPERSERTETTDEDRRRRRHRSPEERSHRDRDRDRDRRHRDRDRDSHRDRDRDRHSRRHRSYSRSRSRTPERQSGTNSTRSKAPLPSQQDAYKTDLTTSGDAPPPPEKEKPNFSNSGRLAAESNTVTVNNTAIVLKYHEPPEARKPPARESWRLYVFKGSDLLEMVELNERSCWLIGRERMVVDFPLDHPSCSKQHAAIQFRFVEKRNEFGDRVGSVKPYVIDLESANGSFVNGDQIPGGRYIELRDKDMLKFGNSSREYVLMLTQPD